MGLHHCDLRQFDHIQDEEEWFAAVLSRHWEPLPHDGDDDYYWQPTDEPTSACPECGSVGACGYDIEGRPMIHTLTHTGRTL